MTILSKRCEVDNFEYHNSLKLSFVNICDLCSNFVECESFLKSNSPDILALCETDLDDSIVSGNFSATAYLSLIRQVLLLICMVLSNRTHLQKTLHILTYVFDWLYYTQCLTSFSSINHLLCLYAQFLILFHLTQRRFS